MDHTEPTTASPPIGDHGPSTGTNKSALFLVFLVVFIDLLGFGIVLPLLPVFGDTYIAQLVPGGRTSGMGGLIIGLLMSAFSLMQFAFAPVWGRISDRVGRKPILLIGLGGSVVFYALFGYACSLPAETAALMALVLLFVARIGQGIAGATIGTAQAVIADCTPPDKRRHGMALIGAAFGIGFTFGPLVGFAALTWFPNNHAAVGYTAAGFSLIALILGIRLLPETRRFSEAPPLDRRWINWSGWQKALGNPAIGPIVLIFFLATLGFASFEVTLALLLRDAMDFDEQHSFLIFAYIGLVLTFTQGYLYRKLAKRFGEIAFMTLGILFMGIGVGALGGVTYLASQDHGLAEVVTDVSGLTRMTYVRVVPDYLLPMLLVSLAASVVGFAFLTPSAQALISRRTGPDQQGEILGVNQSASAMARILGPMLSLPLYKLTHDHLLPYAFAAVLLLLMLPVMPRIKRGDASATP